VGSLEELRGRGISILLTNPLYGRSLEAVRPVDSIDHGLILVEGRPEELIRKHVGRNDDRDRRAHE